MTRKKKLRSVLVALIILLLFVAAIEAVVYLCPSVLFFVMAPFDSDHLCSSGAAFSGGQKYLEWKSNAEVLRSKSMLLQEEEGLQLWQTPAGRWWVSARGGEAALPVLVAQQEAGAYDLREDVRVSPGDVVLDCGAHVGLFAARALSLGARLVVAIEPSPENLACLRRNLATDIEQGRVIVYPKGVWDKEDSLTLYTNDDNSAGDSFVIQTDHAGSVASIPLTTIDLVVEELGLDGVDFIKMDIKGATIRALDGARETLRLYRPQLAIATEEDSDHPQLISRWVTESGLDYQRECGACALVDFKLYPLNLFFY